jgi:hypothetical protein
MKNIDRLAQFVTKYGSSSILIHTIAGTRNWVVCQKIGIDNWLIILCNPMGNVTYNLGTVTNDQHIKLWTEIIRWEIEYKANQILLARDLKKKIQNFKKYYDRNYKKFTRSREKRTKKNKIKK